jgi:hypothetical protein
MDCELGSSVICEGIVGCWRSESREGKLGIILALYQPNLNSGTSTTGKRAAALRRDQVPMDACPIPKTVTVIELVDCAATPSLSCDICPLRQRRHAPLAKGGFSISRRRGHQFVLPPKIVSDMSWRLRIHYRRLSHGQPVSDIVRHVQTVTNTRTSQRRHRR